MHSIDDDPSRSSDFSRRARERARQMFGADLGGASGLSRAQDVVRAEMKRELAAAASSSDKPPDILNDGVDGESHDDEEEGDEEEGDEEKKGDDDYTCGDCGGKGTLRTGERCETCDGTGRTNGEEYFDDDEPAEEEPAKHERRKGQASQRPVAAAKAVAGAACGIQKLTDQELGASMRAGGLKTRDYVRELNRRGHQLTLAHHEWSASRKCRAFGPTDTCDCVARARQGLGLAVGAPLSEFDQQCVNAFWMNAVRS